MQSTFVVVVAGMPIPIPPAVEAEGGAAVEAYITEQVQTRAAAEAPQEDEDER